MDGDVTLTIADGIAEIVLDRPRKMNAVTPAMATAMAAHCAAVDRDPAVRVVLVRGAGTRAFSAGSDLRALAEYKTPWDFRNRLEYASLVRAIRKPVVAALLGWVLGGGCEIALGADLRIAGEGAKLGFPEVQRGWVGGGGASQLLPRLVGYGPANRLLMLGDPIAAGEALRLNLVDEVVPDDDVLDRARALAARLASFSPLAVQAVKAAVRASLSSPLDAGLRYENEMNTLCFSAGDHLEGIHAFTERRDAKFQR